MISDTCLEGVCRMRVEAVRVTLDMAEELSYVQAMSWQQAYKGIVPDDFLAAFTPERRAESFRKAFPTRAEEFYLFRADGKAVGMAILGKARDEDLTDKTGEIHAFYFLPEVWGKGYAAQAMSFCFARLKELGYRQVVLWVLEENPRACRFYEKTGFTFDGLRKEILLGKSLLEIRYSLSLPADH